MSENSLNALIAAIGLNDGANKGFWRIQPRDRYGQFQFMGGGALLYVRDLDGNIRAVPSTYVGPNGKVGEGRYLVRENKELGIKEGVYHVPSNVVEAYKARLGEEYVESKGVKLGKDKDILGNDIELSESEIPNLADLYREDVTANDERLAKGQLSPVEKRNEKDGQKDNPIALLPGGQEAKDPEAVKKMLRDMGIEPSDYDKYPDSDNSKKKPATKKKPEPEAARPEEPAKEEKPAASEETKAPAAKKPAAKKPAAEKPAEKPTAEKKPAAEKKPTPATKKPAEKPAPTASEEKKPAAEKKKPTPAAEKKPAEKKPAPAESVENKEVDYLSPGAIFVPGNKQKGRASVWKNPDGSFYGADPEDIENYENKDLRAGDKYTGPGRKRKSAKPKPAPKKPTAPEGGKKPAPKKPAPKKPAPEVAPEDEPTNIKRPFRGLSNEELVDSLRPSGVYGKGRGPWEKLEDMSSEEYQTWVKTHQALEDEMQLRLMEGSMGREDFMRDPVHRSINEAFWRAMAGEKIELDDLIRRTKKASKDPNERIYGDDEELPRYAPASSSSPDEIVWDEEDETISKPDDGPTEAELSVVQPSPEEDPLSEPVYAEKVSPEELDKLASVEDNSKYFPSFPPSEEQSRIINAVVRADKSTAINASAGSGKTTTLVGVTFAMKDLRPDARILYLQFNTENARESKKKVADNTLAGTTDALFGRQYLAKKKNKLDLERYRSDNDYLHPSSDEGLAKYLKIGDDEFINGQNINPEQVANLVSSAVNKFSGSSDKELSLKHIDISTVGDEDVDMDEALEKKIKEKILSYAQAYWKDITTPARFDKAVVRDENGNPVLEENKAGQMVPKTKSTIVGGKVAILPQHATKMWALSNPDISKYEHNGMPITHVFMDEAQDTRAAIEDVLLRNVRAGKIKLTMVGDSAQGIYRFMGADDAIKRFNDQEAEASLKLSVTRRFPEAIANIANGFLNIRGMSPAKSVKKDGKVTDVPEISIDEAKELNESVALITRNNAGGFMAMAGLLGQGRVVEVHPVLKREFTEALAHLSWIYDDPETRPKEPPVRVPDLGRIRFPGQLMKKLDIAPQSRAAYWARIVRTFKEDLGAMQSIADKVVVARERQISPSDVFNLNAKSGSKGSFAGIDWEVQGSILAIKGDGTYNIPGGSFKPWRELVMGGKIKSTHRSGAQVQRDGSVGMLLPNGEAPDWKSMQLNDGTWVNTINIPNGKDRSAYLNAIAGLFAEDTKPIERGDILITTAHRSKGKEWHHVYVGEDFNEPSSDPSPLGGEPIVTLPNDDEINLAYVAVTRGMKSVSLGSLKWVRDYVGVPGLKKANKHQRRDENFMVDEFKQHEKDQKELLEKSDSKDSNTSPETIAYTLSGMSSTADELASPYYDGETPKGKDEFLEDWVELATPRTYSARLGGSTWNIRENKDGTISLRPRTNSKRLFAKTYNSWDDLIAEFPNYIENGRSLNKEKLKNLVRRFDDEEGTLAKMIDSEADEQDILAKLEASPEFKKYSEAGLFKNNSQLQAALRNHRDSRKKSPKNAKPSIIQKPQFTPIVPPTAPAGPHPRYVEHPNLQIKPGQVIDRTKITEANINLGTGDIFKDEEYLFENYPDARYEKDGSIVLYKKTLDDTDGPEAGTTYELELRVIPNRTNQWVVQVKSRAVDPEEDFEDNNLRDGDDVEDKPGQETYYHYDKVESLKALYTKVENLLDGLESKNVRKKKESRYTSGIGGFLNQLRGTTDANNKGTRKTNNFVYRYIFGQRRDGNSVSRNTGDSKAKLTALKIRTVSEQAMLDIYGENEVINRSAAVMHQRIKRGSPGVLDAIDSGDVEMARTQIRKAIAALPDQESARAEYREAFKSVIEARFPEATDRRKMALTQIFDEFDQKTPVGVYARTPYVDSLGIPFGVGYMVKVSNNIGGFSVGKVVRLRKFDNPNGGKHVYGDQADVEFAGGNIQKVNVAKNGVIVPVNTKPTSYLRHLKEDELKQLRHEEAGFEEYHGYFYDADNNIVDRLSTADAPGTEFKVDSPDLFDQTTNLGRKIFDDEGIYLGQIISKPKTGTNKTTGQKVASIEILTPSGDRDRLVVTDKVRTAPPSERFDKATESKSLATSAVARKAKELSDKYASNRSGAAREKIQTNPSNNTPEEAKTAIKGSKDAYGVVPTEEQRNIKDELISMGEEVQKDVDQRVISQLRALGYEVPDNADTDPRALISLLDQDLVAKGNLYAKARQDAIDLENSILDGVSPEELDELFKDLESSRYADRLDGGATGVDTDKLSIALSKAGLEHMALEVFNQSDSFETTKRSSYMALAFKALKDEDLRDKLAPSNRRIADAFSENKTLRTKAYSTKKDYNFAIREARKSSLEAQGVEFDNVSVDLFENRLKTFVEGEDVDSNATFKVRRNIEEAFDYMPRGVILSLIRHLKENNGELRIRAGVKRGFFKATPDGSGAEIHVSKSRGNPNGLNDSSDTMLHELWHFVQKTNPNLRALEHAYLYDRAVDQDGKLPPIVNISGNGHERALAIPGLGLSYSSKSYSRGPAFLDSDSDASELSTTVMQELFTSPGLISIPRGEVHYVKDRLIGDKLIPVFSPKKGPNGGWIGIDPISGEFEYTDDEIIAKTGRATSEGIDKNIQHFGNGIMLWMNEWSSTEGLGDGNAVDKD